jgi:hypothetical protein
VGTSVVLLQTGLAAITKTNVAQNLGFKFPLRLRVESKRVYSHLLSRNDSENLIATPCRAAPPTHPQANSGLSSGRIILVSYGDCCLTSSISFARHLTHQPTNQPTSSRRNCRHSTKNTTLYNLRRGRYVQSPLFLFRSGSTLQSVCGTVWNRTIDDVFATLMRGYGEKKGSSSRRS